MNIDPKLVRVDVFRSKGQSNWLNSCPIGVRVTYLPTGIQFESEAERSQHRNRSRAFDKLFEYLKMI